MKGSTLNGRNNRSDMFDFNMVVLHVFIWIHRIFDY